MLQSCRKLRDHKNYIMPQHGFNSDIADELRNKIKRFSENERFVELLMDEMKISEN